MGESVMFIGEYQHNLDAKGRIIVPVKFREELGDKMIVTAGLDGNLLIYTTDQFQETAQKLMNLPMTNAKARQYRAHTLGKASDCDLDGQGRILIPANLIQAAGLKKNCVIVGLYDHVELWDKEVWESYYQDASSQIDDISEGLTEFLV